MPQMRASSEGDCTGVESDKTELIRKRLRVYEKLDPIKMKRRSTSEPLVDMDSDVIDDETAYVRDAVNHEWGEAFYVKKVEREKEVPKHDHHVPPTGYSRIMLPFNFFKHGIRLHYPEATESPSLRLILHQLLFWEELNEDVTSINSLKIHMTDTPPYGSAAWQNGPRIGIYKRCGKAIGQCVWLNLVEAQAFLKMGALLIDQKIGEIELKKKDTAGIKFCYDYCGMEFHFHDFFKKGILRDSIFDEDKKNAKPEAGEVHDKIVKQIEAESFSNNIYEIGSIEVATPSAFEAGSRLLIGIHKKSGFGSGQWIWFSIHELQHLLVELMRLLKDTWAELETKSKKKSF
jgi:hypothetical protein